MWPKLLFSICEWNPSCVLALPILELHAAVDGYCAPYDLDYMLVRCWNWTTYSAFIYLGQVTWQAELGRGAWPTGGQFNKQ